MANNKFVSKVCSNTKSDLIEITEDKLENILTKFLKDYKKTIEWMTPLGLFLSFLITSFTADFKDFIDEILCSKFKFSGCDIVIAIHLEITKAGDIHT